MGTTELLKVKVTIEINDKKYSKEHRITGIAQQLAKVPTSRETIIREVTDVLIKKMTEEGAFNVDSVQM